MLNLLKIKANGYKMLDDSFELNLTSRTRVYQEEKTPRHYERGRERQRC